MNKLQQANGYHAHGAGLYFSEDEGTTWLKVANVVSVTPPAVVTEEVDVTDHDSEGYKKFIAGMKDGGEIAFTVNVFDTNNAEKLFSLAESAKIVSWKVEVPTEPVFTIEVPGFLKSFNIAALDSGAAITAEGALRCSGKPEYKFGE